MQTLHYEEATLADAGIHNSNSTAVANLAHANSDHQALLLEHQAHLAALQQQIATLTASKLQNQAAVPPKTITVDAQTFAGSTVDTKSLVDIIKDTIIQQSKSSNSNRNRSSNRNGGTRNTSTTRSSRRYSNNNYCWTHGINSATGHSSVMCINPRNATYKNLMGGKPRIWIKHLNPVLLATFLDKRHHSHNSSANTTAGGCSWSLCTVSQVLGQCCQEVLPGCACG